MRSEDQLHVELSYKVLYSEEGFLVADKPAPLPVHPVGRFKEKTLLSLLQKDFPSEAAGLRIVNRLDSETSGLVIAAKNSEMAGRLGLLFENRKVYKEYRAVVLGVPEPRSGTIATALGTEIRSRHRVRVPDPQGQAAVTRYEVLKENGKRALVKLVPETGRTHQLRAHLSFLGNPVAGDKIYIDPEIFERYRDDGWQEDMLAAVGAERLLLHAVRLEFLHPVTGERMKFFSEPPGLFSL